MPSLNELNELYINLVAVGGFTTGYYWSSGETDADNAWAIFFINGQQLDDLKVLSYHIRAVLTF